MEQTDKKGGYKGKYEGCEAARQPKAALKNVKEKSQNRNMLRDTPSVVYFRAK